LQCACSKRYLAVKDENESTLAAKMHIDTASCGQDDNESTPPSSNYYDTASYILDEMFYHAHLGAKAEKQRPFHHIRFRLSGVNATACVASLRGFVLASKQHPKKIIFKPIATFSLFCILIIENV